MKTTKDERAEWLRCLPAFRHNIIPPADARRLIDDVDDATALLDAARDANTQAYHNPPCEECLGCRVRTFLKEPSDD